MEQAKIKNCEAGQKCKCQRITELSDRPMVAYSNAGMGLWEAFTRDVKLRFVVDPNPTLIEI